MYPLLDYHFFLYFVLFFIALFISFYLPGKFVMKFIDTNISVRTTLLELCLGFVLFTAQGFLFGYLHIRWMTYIYVALAILYAFFTWKDIKLEIIYILKRIAKDKIVTVILLLGMICQSIVMFGSNSVTSDGVRFLGSNIVDGIMHVSYIQSMQKTFPPIEPAAYNLPLQNYHYWLDLSIAELSRIWLIPGNYIFFQLLPLFISVVTGIASYILLRLWTHSKIAGLWSLFFLYLGGDAAYLFMLAMHGSWGFQIPVIDNGITQFLNMPHAAAKMIFLTGLIPFYLWVKTNEKRWGIIAIILFSTLIGFKVYFGIYTMLGFGLVVLVKVIKMLLQLKRTIKSKRKKIIQKELFTVGLLFTFIAISLLIYIPPNAHSGGLQYYPMEWPKIFLNADNLNWRDWFLRMQVYENAHNIKNIAFYNLLAVLITLVSIHGTRLVGFWPNKNLMKLLGWEHLVFFLPGIFIFHILGFTTLQAAGSFNVFNFFVVSTVVMALFASVLLYQLTQKRKVWASLLILIIVILTVPRAVHEVYADAKDFITDNGGLVAKDEVSALQYINVQSLDGSIIQSHPQNTFDKTTPYVAYFSGRNSYASGVTMLDSHGQPIKIYEEKVEKLFQSKTSTEFLQLAKTMHIQYIYLQKNPEQKLLFPIESTHFVKKYENNSVIILELLP